MNSHATFVIRGGRELKGEIEVKGAKNAALKILAAAVLSREPCVIKNLPDIEDVQRMEELLRSIGVKISKTKQHTTIETSEVQAGPLDRSLVESIRASILLAGPLLARHGEVIMPHPGGDKIGQRPIDIFLDGFKALGVTVEVRDRSYRLTTKKLTGGVILLPRVKITVTEEMIMGAVLAEGETIIKNAAMEPEIIALADYLNAQGARIRGAGTPTIIINGVKQISGGTYTVIPDRIEAGTFIILGLLTNSEIKVTRCNPSHLESLLWHLEKAGAVVEVGSDFVVTRRHQTLKAQSMITHEYPGFTTDLQPPYTVLMTQAEGPSIIHDPIHQGGRLFYTDLLNSMGANIIMCDPYRVVVNGPTILRGRYLTSPDIRAGMALILAALIAEGETIIDNVYQVDRGYEHIAEKLVGLGADIKRSEGE